MNSPESLRAKVLEVSDTHLAVELEDGSRHSAPIALFPNLADATSEERARWYVIGGGTGVYWALVDEHVSIFTIVHPDRTIPINPAAAERLIEQNRERRRHRSA